VPPITPIVQTGNGLNPGYIQATPFYNTTNHVQSQYSWDSAPFQMGPTFNPTLAQQGRGSAQPFGLQNMASALTPQDMAAIINGTYRAPQGTAPATRIQGYNPAVMSPPPGYQGQINLSAPRATTPQAAPTAPAMSQVSYDAVNAKLGDDWLWRQQNAAQNGDWATYYKIQAQVDAILNPPVTAPVAPTAPVKFVTGP
jgi:hypothetical protein